MTAAVRGESPEKRGGGDPSDVPLGDLVSRLAAEGRELASVELARGRALMRERGRAGARVVAFAAGALALALVGVAALAGAAVAGIAALGLAAGAAALIVGAALIALAVASALIARGGAKGLLAAPPRPRPAPALGRAGDRALAGDGPAGGGDVSHSRARSGAHGEGHAVPEGGRP